jgi:two-component system chemotaxis response regulator CheB
MRSTIKVLVVDDSALVRQMVSRALSSLDDIEVVGIARTGVEALERIA